ncbi:AAA family ATPase [Bacillus sp. PS06]|uniref:AAA family ATPase n=1 Tax=Bacillus sp. PS06 TaxID=2764176 RepID=UPI001780B1E7|nr:AAA family ATPase [Bacillus sp. PS06]MBD8069288.1 ATP-dependent Clp protease ATP-binding subunit [Bacillus sp. PS06]
MSRQTIYTYSKKYFNNLYEDKEKQGIKLISLSQVTSNSQLEEYFEDEQNIEIDITSAILYLKKNEESVYNFEKYLKTIIDGGISLIVEEDYAEDTLDILYYTFDEIKALENYSSNESSELGEKNETQFPKTKKIINLTNDGIQELYEHLDETIIGHNDFKKAFIEKVRSFKIFNGIGDHKILSVFLLGPSGVGKTEFARSIHHFLDDKPPLIKINFGNYSSKDSLNSLIGSPRGYVGSEDGELPKKIKKSPVGIILIDEFDRADNKVFDFFLELLEEGSFTNSLGEVFNLNGYIIFFTSNLNQNSFKEKLPSELRSRLDLKGVFSNLNSDDKESYFTHRLDQLINNLEIENRESVKQEIILAKKNTLEKYNNLREINKMIRDEITKRLYVLTY